MDKASVRLRFWVQVSQLCLELGLAIWLRLRVRLHLG